MRGGVDESGGRVELLARIDAMHRTMSGAPPARIATELESLRRLAHRAGATPAVTVIHAIDSLLAQGQRGPSMSGWIGLLHDAAVCQANDTATCDTFAAICTLRLHG